MPAAPLPATEPARLAALQRYDILDSPPEAAFDDLTAIASQVCGYPITVMSLVDRDRQWFKSRIGLDVVETPRAVAFCAHAILQADLFEVPDAPEDPRFADNELVTSGAGFRAYAGMPLETPDGHRLGTLCVLDRVPRTLTDTQRDILKRLANQAVALLEARAVARQLTAQSVRLQQFASVVQRTSNAVVITDADRRITWVNPAFEQMTGYTSAQVRDGGPGRLLQLAGTEPAAVARIAGALDQRVPVRHLVANRARDGRTYWSDLNIQPVSEGGVFTGYCAVASDVTALVDSQAAQRRRLERSEAVSRLQQAVMTDAAPRDTLSRALDAAVELSGSAHGYLAKFLEGGGHGAAMILPQAIVNAHWSDAQRQLHRATTPAPMPSAMLDPHVRAVLAAGSQVVLHGAEARATGMHLFEGAADTRALLIVPISVAGATVALLALGNRPDGYDSDVIEFLAPLLTVVGEFLAARRQAEARRAASQVLEQERRRLRLALLASSVGVFELDLASGLVWWDARMWEIHGLTPPSTQWTLSDWVRVLHADDADRVVDELVAIGEGDNPLQLLQTQYRVVRPDGSERVLRANGQVFRSDGARMLVGVNLDVTEDVALQHELDAARQTAESAAVAKSQFLATMSHEIRTPMNGILGMLELLLRSPLDDEQRDRAQMAHSSAEALLSIINDILDLSKLDADQVVLETIAYDPRRIVSEVTALLASRASDKGLTLTADVHASLPAWLEGDPMRLRQILINLVGNAIKFTSAGGVTLRLRHGAGLLACEVEDTGEGIAPETQARLFQRFVQADASTTRRFGGTGLGLAICRQLVGLMGGHIAVRSTPGVGSVFSFTVRADGAAAPVAPAKLPSAQDVLAPIEPLRILAAEDNVVNQRLLRAFLAPARHDVTVVASGVEVLAALSTGPFDLVLMDIQMPGMDGVTCTQAIRRRSGPERDVPIVALTANAMAGDRERYLAGGFTDYVSKPVTMVSLAAAIKRATTSVRAAALQT